MRKLSFLAIFSALILVGLSSCEKEKTAPAPETYSVSFNAVTGATVTSTLQLKHKLTYATGDEQYGELNGSITWQGLSAAPDTVKMLFGGPTPGVLLIATRTSSSVSTGLSNSFYTFTNAVNGGITFNNMPIMIEPSSKIAQGQLYLLIGKNNNYVRVNLDKVTKL